MPQIIPTILVKNLSEFGERVKKIKKLGFDFAQIDIADGKFVKNKTFWLLEGNLDYELHLMVKNPEEIIKQVKNSKKIQKIIFHFEAVKQVNKIIKLIKNYNFQAGLAINPETNILKIKKYLKNLDLVLIMGVHPGFSGQKFIPETINKIKKLRKLNSKILIEVDGGINAKNANKILKAGADILAVGGWLEKAVACLGNI